MGWLSFLTGGAGELVEKVGNAIDQNVTSDEERLKLRNELAKGLQDFTIKAYEFEEKDRESARTREVEIAKSGQSNYIMTVLIVLALGGASWVIWFLLNKDIRERELAFMILGFVIAIVKDIFGYYFGSSRGSAIKDETIRRAL